MPNVTPENFIVSPFGPQTTAGASEFAGFKPPTSNTTYTPNQFFDVVMPHASRGCLRIVAFLIRKTLGWCDANGNPQHEQIEVSYGELVRRVGVSRDMIREALDEAIRCRFIECLREGRASAAGDFGESALFALKWDASPVCVRSLADFQGFHEGEGHRTDIPNEFFDRIIPKENLSVIKVVGSVIRYSIGFQAKRGRRRQQATLAYSHILRTAGLSSRRTLAAAIREAVSKNFIVRLDAGCVSAFPEKRRSATYAVRWSDGFHPGMSEPTSQKRIPAGLWINRSEKDTSEPSDQSEKDTSTGRKRIPVDQSEKETIETKSLNEKQKQQAASLKREGFDARTAAELVTTHPLEVIERQIRWIGLRNVAKSRAGLLRRAIEGDWPRPFSRDPLLEPPAIPDSSRERHRQRFDPDYFAWLRNEEARCRQSRPDEYLRFEAKRARDREDIQRERSAGLRATLLAAHDDELKRLLSFQRFHGLPDFWQWDANFNNQPFKPQS